MGVRAIRQQLGMSQVNLAMCLGLTQTAISYWERGDGHPSPGIAARLIELASWHGVTIAYEDVYDNANKTARTKAKAA